MTRRHGIYRRAAFLSVLYSDDFSTGEDKGHLWVPQPHAGAVCVQGWKKAAVCDLVTEGSGATGQVSYITPR